MEKRKALLGKLYKAIQAGDRRPQILALVVKVKRCPDDLVGLYQHPIRFWLGI